MTKAFQVERWHNAKMGMPEVESFLEEQFGVVGSQARVEVWQETVMGQ